MNPLKLLAVIEQLEKNLPAIMSRLETLENQLLSLAASNIALLTQIEINTRKE